VVDGRVDEAAWQQAARLEPVMHVPDFGTAPTERTEFLVAHDGEYIYFGCRAFDSDPDRVQARSLRRNETQFVNDWCALNLDSLNDGETTLLFATTPAGLRSEAIIADDASGGMNFDWNTFWDAAAVRTDKGWSAEMRIPLSSLAFQAQGGRVLMGMSAWRRIARKNEQVTYPAISPRWGGMSLFKASQMRPIVLEEVDAPRAVYMTPYVLGGGGHLHTLTGDGASFGRATNRVHEAGLDVRYGVGPNFSLDLTANTDFAQVEADDQQVNLDRFSLFFPEKRRFFQERGAVFEFPLGNQERLFHSRRIGLADGRAVRIYGGGRLVGRVGEWDVGALNMHTAESETLPSENHGVLRVRRRVLNESSYVGGLVTSRIGAGGRYNLVYGSDAVLRILEHDYLTLNWAQAFDDGEVPSPEQVGIFDRSFSRVRWERRGLYGPMYDLSLSHAGNGFEPALGFLQRRNYTRGDLRLGYGWNPGQSSPFLRYAAEVGASAVRRMRVGTVETAAIEPSLAVQTRGGHTLIGAVRHRHEDLDEDFQLAPEVLVPAGTYRYTEGSLQYQPAPGNVLRAVVAVEAGQFFDGTRRSVEVGPNWSPSRHLGLSASYRVDRLAFPARDQRFTAQVARLRGELMLSTDISTAAFIQYNSLLDAIATNVRFRYNPREGEDLYIVWNEGVNSAPADYDPVRPRSQERTILAKYSRTFSLGF
jgi:hypothetical protein